MVPIKAMFYIHIYASLNTVLTLTKYEVFLGREQQLAGALSGVYNTVYNTLIWPRPVIAFRLIVAKAPRLVAKAPRLAHCRSGAARAA